VRSHERIALQNPRRHLERGGATRAAQNAKRAQESYDAAPARWEKIKCDPEGWRYMDGAKTQSRATGTFFCTASTAFHRFPQSFCEIPLANISCRFYYARRLIGKENFTSQFKDGGKGKTEPVNFELNEEVQTSQFNSKEAARVKPSQPPMS
jgi:hypothetical protein